MPHRAHIRRLTEAELDRYDLVPRWVARRAVLVRVPFLPPGAAGMTSGRFILLRQDEPMDGTSALIAHELVHVRQFTEMGRIVFLARYVASYLRHLSSCRNHQVAYRAIPQEVEAYERAGTWWQRLRT